MGHRTDNIFLLTRKVRNYTKDIKLKFKIKVSEECENLITRMLAHDVKYRLTPEEILNHSWLNECETYKTVNGSSVPIDDNNLVNSSHGKFHYKYEINSELVQKSTNKIVFLGENINNGCKVAIKREEFKDRDDMERLLKEKNTKRGFYSATSWKTFFRKKSLQNTRSFRLVRV